MAHSDYRERRSIEGMFSEELGFAMGSPRANDPILASKRVFQFHAALI